jgi:hypothetical protein
VEFSFFSPEKSFHHKGWVFKVPHYNILILNNNYHGMVIAPINVETLVIYSKFLVGHEGGLQCRLIMSMPVKEIDASRQSMPLLNC